MQASGGGNKRAITGPDGSQKKGKNDTKEIKTTTNILDAKFVTTELNEKRFDLIPVGEARGATKEQIQLARQGYISLFGDKDALQEMTKIGKLAAKVVRYKSKTISTLQATEITKSGVQPEEWLFFTTALANEQDFIQSNIAYILSPEEIQEARLFLIRVAHTPPQVMCTKIKFGKAPATKASSCWYGAKTALGSWYHKPTEKKQKTINLKQSLAAAEQKKPSQTTPKDQVKATHEPRKEPTKISPTPKKKPASETIELHEDESDDESSSSESDTSSSSEESRRSRRKASKRSKTLSKKRKEKKQTKKKKSIPSDNMDEEMDEATSDMEVEPTTKTPKSSGQSKLKVTSTCTEIADVTASRREHQVRIQLMIKLPAHKKKTANVLAHQRLESLYEAIYEEDDKACLLPWLIKDSAEAPAITNPMSFPATYLELKKYMDKWRPKKDSNGWVKIRVATNLAPVHMTSLDDSVMTAWYDEFECKGYLCPIQNADKSETIGVFLYSGHFIDHIRLTQVILNELRTKNSTKDWKIACRTKACKEIETKDRPSGPFTMAYNQLVHVEVDSTQVRWVNQIIYNRFNKDHNNIGRPGGYNLRWAPAKTLLKTGTDGEKARREMLTKHVAVVKSLVLLTSDEIKNLDEPYTDETDNSTQTLRTLLANLTFPLAPQLNQTVSPLFHSIDEASSGRDLGAKVYFTAYVDRAPEAAKLIAILPAFVKEMVGDAAAKRWIHHQCEETDVDFHYDAEGNWLGTFTTEDDQIQRDIIDEYMGFNIQLANMEMLNGNKRRVLTSDDASMKSFKMSTYDAEREAQALEDAEEGESEAAAASKVQGGSGTEN